MKASALLQGVYALGLTNYRDEASKWAIVALKYHSAFGGSNSITVTGISALDIMLRQLEREQLADLSKPEKSEADFGFHLLSILSDSWLLGAYEAVRAAKQLQQPSPKLRALHDALALARMPVAKGEIGGADNYRKKTGNLPPLLLHPIGDGDDNSPIPYRHDGLYIIPKGACADTGAIVWYPIDLKSQQTVAICRRDLSDSFLKLFD